MEEKITTTEKISLTRVGVAGKKWFNCFVMNDDTLVEIETTQEDFEQQKGKNPINPIIENGNFHHSYERYKFDTANGDLNEGEYFDNQENYLVKVNNYWIRAGKDEIVSDQIDAKVVDDAVSKAQLFISSINER